MLDIKMLRFVFIVSIIIVSIAHGESEKFKERCNVETNSTWICNYIPNYVPEQFEHVRIVEFKRKDKNVVVDSSSFTDESWLKVQTLEFSDTTGWDLICIFAHECFKGLNSLKELRIYMSSFHFNPGVFVGLPLVHTLDLSRCYRLVIEELTKQLQVPNTLPNLQKLYLSELGTYKKRNNINLAFVETLSTRNITIFDISKTHITFANFTAIVKLLKSLECINVSYSVIADTWNDNIVQADIDHVKLIDMSHTTLPSKMIPVSPLEHFIANRTFNHSDIKNAGSLNCVFTPLVVNASGLIPDTSSVRLDNTTVLLDEQFNWKVKQLILRQNNIIFLDFLVRCSLFKFTSLVHMDLSDNGLQMLRPTTCVPNLEIFDLSKNDLFKMYDMKPNMFKALFSTFTKLRVINLSNNQLLMVPRELFKSNKYIEIIDLSFNKIEQIHLDFANLHRLRVFDISNNNIKVLDEVSISNLNVIPSAKPLMSGEAQCSVIFTSNPIRCSSCDSKPFIKWLVHSKTVNVNVLDLTCTDEDGTNVNTDASVVRKVQNICNRKTVIISSSVSTCVTLLIIALIVSFLYRRKRRRQRQRNRTHVINKLIEGVGQYEFVVFLSYSSRDDPFVQENVIDQLNENLQLMTGTDRNLVCTGDQYLRPGFMVLDETINCLERASVIIIVVSNNFCRSAYCQNEFDQAYMQRKPIMLMFMEHVEEDLMMPTMKQLYKRDVRILWTVENGQFLLKTTWENVCRSVLDKVQV